MNKVITNVNIADQAKLFVIPFNMLNKNMTTAPTTIATTKYPRYASPRFIKVQELSMVSIANPNVYFIVFIFRSLGFVDMK